MVVPRYHKQLYSLNNRGYEVHRNTARIKRKNQIIKLLTGDATRQRRHRLRVRKRAGTFDRRCPLR